MKPAEFLVRVLDCPYPNPLPSVVNGYHGDSWESMDFCGISWLPAHLPRPTAHQKQQNLPYTHGVAPRAPTPTRYSSTLTKAKSQHSPLNCSARPPPVACVRFVADHVCIRARGGGLRPRCRSGRPIDKGFALPDPRGSGPPSRPPSAIFFAKILPPEAPAHRAGSRRRRGPPPGPGGAVQERQNRSPPKSKLIQLFSPCITVIHWRADGL